MRVLTGLKINELKLLIQGNQNLHSLQCWETQLQSNISATANIPVVSVQTANINIRFLKVTQNRKNNNFKQR